MPWTVLNPFQCLTPYFYDYYDYYYYIHVFTEIKAPIVKGHLIDASNHSRDTRRLILTCFQNQAQALWMVYPSVHEDFMKQSKQYYSLPLLPRSKQNQIAINALSLR